MDPFIIPATILFWPIMIPYFAYSSLKASYYGFNSIQDMWDYFYAEEQRRKKYSKYDKLCLIIDYYTNSTKILIKIINEDINRNNYHIDFVSNKTEAEKYLQEYNIKYDYIFFNDKIINLSSDDFDSKLIQIKDSDSIVDCKVHNILYSPIMNKFKVDDIFKI